MLRARDRRARPGDAARHLGRARRPHLRPGTRSPTWPPCGSPRPATASWSWARSGSARPTSPPRSDTSRSAAGSRVHAARADKLFTRLRAARLDNTLDAELRRLARVDLLILDDFALKPLDADRDQRLLRARRRTAPTSQHHRHLEPGTRRVADHDERRPARPVRRRPAHLRRPHPDHRRPVLPATTPTTTQPTLTTKEASVMLTHTSRWSHAPGNTVVPSRWQATPARPRLRTTTHSQDDDVAGRWTSGAPVGPTANCFTAEPGTQPVSTLIQDLPSLCPDRRWANPTPCASAATLG